MKEYKIYECEICGKTSKDYKEILKCECNCLGLTLEEKEEWEHLKKLVKHSEQLLKKCNEENIERYQRIYDEDMDNLKQFESTHKL